MGILMNYKFIQPTDWSNLENNSENAVVTTCMAVIGSSMIELTEYMTPCRTYHIFIVFANLTVLPGPLMEGGSTADHTSHMCCFLITELNFCAVINFPPLCRFFLLLV